MGLRGCQTAYRFQRRFVKKAPAAARTLHVRRGFQVMSLQFLRSREYHITDLAEDIGMY